MKNLKYCTVKIWKTRNIALWKHEKIINIALLKYAKLERLHC